MKTNYSEHDKDRIKKIVFMENENRKFLNAEGQRIQTILKPFVRQKVLKADGTTIKKLKDLVSFPHTAVKPFTKDGSATISAYFDVTSYNIAVTCNMSINGGSYDDKTYYCVYHKGYKYVAKLSDGVLTELLPLEDMPLLSEKEQLEEYDKMLSLEKELDAQKNKVFHSLRR